MTPVREPARPVGKMPLMRTLAPRPQPPREAAPATIEELEVAEEAPPAAPEGPVSEPVDEPAPHAPAAARPETPLKARRPTKEAAPPSEPEESAAAPLRREDYMPASGTSRMMVPR